MIHYGNYKAKYKVNSLLNIENSFMLKYLHQLPLCMFIICVCINQSYASLAVMDCMGWCNESENISGSCNTQCYLIHHEIGNYFDIYVSLRDWGKNIINYFDICNSW